MKQYRAVAIHPSKSSNNIAVIGAILLIAVSAIIHLGEAIGYSLFIVLSTITSIISGAF